MFGLTGATAGGCVIILVRQNATCKKGNDTGSDTGSCQDVRAKVQSRAAVVLGVDARPRRPGPKVRGNSSANEGKGPKAWV